MIRTVRIPTTVARMGCTPGGDCCSECAQTGPPIGSPSTHVHNIPGARNTALHSQLRATQCDQDGNCYTDGVLTSAPLTYPLGVSAPASTTLYIAGAALLVGLMFLKGRR